MTPKKLEKKTRTNRKNPRHKKVQIKQEDKNKTGK
jgi:hypothetical protein